MREHVVEVGSGDVVIIDKLYGPAAFGELRITANVKANAWVIERKRIDTGQWVEEARIAGQREWEYDDD